MLQMLEIVFDIGGRHQAPLNPSLSHPKHKIMLHMSKYCINKQKEECKN
jgi:hypothetical protein